MTACPTRDDLAGLLDGRLGDPDRAAVEGHVERCARCQDRLDELTRPPDFRPAANPPADAAEDELIRRLGGRLPTEFPTAGANGRPADPSALPAIVGYDIGGVVGRGGAGVVYRARQARLGRDVALKMLAAGTADDLARFHREAEAVAQLQHPNIVQVYEVGEVDGRPFLVMEFVPGGSLAARLAGAPQPEAAAARLVEQLARAAQFAHDCGVLHRDIKPANVLLSGVRGQESEVSEDRGGSPSLTPDPCPLTPKLADFGLAKHLGADTGQTRTGAVLGTPSYMAPEQARGDKALTPAADVYALGAVLYECLTGRPPFRGETPVETVLQVLHAEPVPPRQLRPQVSRDLETICLKCLQKEPVKRYAAAADLADDLRRFLAGEPIRARPVGRAERAWRWCRRHPREAALGSLAAAAMLLGGGGWLWLAHDRADRADRRAATARAVHAALQSAAVRRGRAANDPAALAEALADARRAEGLVEQGEADDDARQQVRTLVSDLEGEARAARERADAAVRDRRMAERLEAIQLDQATVRGTQFNTVGAEGAYAAAFREYGIDVAVLPTDEAADRVRRSAVRADLVAALDDWMMVRREGRGDARPLAAIARAADPDEWRGAFRTALAAGDGAAIARLAADARTAHLSPATARILGDILRGSGAAARAVPLLEQAHRDNPGDFWVAHSLAMACQQCRPPRWEAAVRYHTAALALRPRSPGVYLNLSNALLETGAAVESAAVCEAGLRVDPSYAPLHNNLGTARSRLGDLDAARANFEAALRLRPEYPEAQFNLGTVLLRQGATDLALAPLREATRLNPRDADAWLHLGSAWLLEHRPDDAAACFRTTISFRDGYAEAHCNLGILLQQQARYDEALASLRRGHELGSRRPGWQYPSAEWVKACERQRELDRRLPAILRGDVRPAAAERTDVGQVCEARRLYAAAARQFAAALDSDAAMKEEERPDLLHTAARAAARAGCGDGADRPAPDTAEQARWRTRARDWLRAELTLRAAALEKAPPRERTAPWNGVREWRRDPALAGLRDEPALARLPATERDECRRLWAEGDALVARYAPAAAVAPAGRNP